MCGDGADAAKVSVIVGAIAGESNTIEAEAEKGTILEAIKVSNTVEDEAKSSAMEVTNEDIGAVLG